MGKSTPSPPKPPNYSQLVKDASAANLEAIVKSAGINAVDLNAPWGSSTYERNPDGTPKSQTISLAPDQQALFGLQSEIAKMLAQRAIGQGQYLPQDQFSLDGLPYAPGTYDFADQYNKTAQTQYDRAAGLLRPEFERQTKQLDQRLTDRGLPLTGEAYGGAMDRLNDSQNEAYLKAAQDAYLRAGQEESRLYGMSSDVRNNAVNEALLQRNQPFNELAAYLGTAPTQPTPQAQQLPAYQVQPVDTMGAANMAYQGQMNSYNAALQQQQGMMSGLFGLGAAGISLLSSREAKDRIGEAPAVLDKIKDMPIDRWRYRDYEKHYEPGHVGPYAEDFRDNFGLGDGASIPFVDAIGVLFKAVKEIAQRLDRMEAARV